MEELIAIDNLITVEVAKYSRDGKSIYVQVVREDFDLFDFFGGFMDYPQPLPAIGTLLTFRCSKATMFRRIHHNVTTGEYYENPVFAVVNL